MKPEAIPAPTYEPLDAEACKQHLALVKSMHCCRPVLVDGKEEYLQVVNGYQEGGRIQVDVWLTGVPAPVDMKLIEFPPAKQ